MKTIDLGHGRFAIVDDEDYGKVAPFSWFAMRVRNTWYAYRTWRESRRKRFQAMHRLLMGLEGSRTPLVDHKDGNGLNNTRENLRTATTAQNLWNAKHMPVGDSGVRGVYWDPRGKTWRAQICVNGKKLSLGSFATIEEAGRARRSAELAHFGAFATNNS